MKDLVGKKFNRFTVIKFAFKKHTANFWECVCDCGNIRNRSTSELQTNKIKSCGCLRKENHCQNTRAVKEGNVYGHMEVLSFAGTEKGRSKFLCKCVCGNEKILWSSNLRDGKTVSCGCKRLLKDSMTVVVNSIFSDYRARAIKKNLDFSLERALFQGKIDTECFYCDSLASNTKQIICKDESFNKSYDYNGLDRIDNTKGYLEDNVVACCKTCNVAKNTMTHEEYLQFIKRVYEFNFK